MEKIFKVIVNGKEFNVYTKTRKKAIIRGIIRFLKNIQRTPSTMVFSVRVVEPTLEVPSKVLAELEEYTKRMSKEIEEYIYSFEKEIKSV